MSIRPAQTGVSLPSLSRPDVGGVKMSQSNLQSNLASPTLGAERSNLEAGTSDHPGPITRHRGLTPTIAFFNSSSIFVTEIQDEIQGE